MQPAEELGRGESPGFRPRDSPFCMPPSLPRGPRPGQLPTVPAAGDVDERALPLEAGMVAAVGPSEVHWFENPSNSEFSFVEFWSPPPTETVWVRDDDI